MLLVLMVPFRVVIFGSPTSAGLARMAGRRRSVSGFFADTGRAWRLLGRLALARLLGVFGALYEALMVFVVPAGIDEGLAYDDAQRRSEELVRLRWGPGRFRALGIPRMVPANAAYSYLVRRFGYRGVLIEVVIVLGVLLLPVAFVLMTQPPAIFLLAAVLTWGPIIIASVVWGWLIQPAPSTACCALISTGTQSPVRSRLPILQNYCTDVSVKSCAPIRPARRETHFW